MTEFRQPQDPAWMTEHDALQRAGFEQTSRLDYEGAYLHDHDSDDRLVDGDDGSPHTSETDPYSQYDRH